MTLDARGTAVLLCWLLAAVAVASPDGVLEGELARWLDGEVAPELGETLSLHPRFKGETVRLVTLTPDTAGGRSNALAQAVERRLRQRLLEVEGVRLAVDGPRRDCEPPRRIDYLVRIEVADDGRDRGRIHIAVVDVAESVWVSGISHQWRGRLSASQRRALSTSVNRASPGSAGSPIPLDDAEGVAEAIKADLACTLPRDLDGALFVATPAPPALSRVGLALQSALMFEPLAAVTPDRDQAAWLLTLEAEGTDARVRELNLSLAAADGGHRQRLASVFVSGSLTGAGTAAAPPAAEPPEHRTASRSRVSDLLSPLEMGPADPEGICDHHKARMNSCVEISFVLHDPAYLFLVSTRDHQVVDAPCGGTLRQSEAGAHRYRLRVPPGRFALDPADTGPDAGFYVLAVREQGVAERLREALARGAPDCGRAHDGVDRGWLAALDRVLEGSDGRVAWRALHVAHDTTGIVAL